MWALTRRLELLPHYRFEPKLRRKSRKLWPEELADTCLSLGRLNSLNIFPEILAWLVPTANAWVSTVVARGFNGFCLQPGRWAATFLNPPLVCGKHTPTFFTQGGIRIIAPTVKPANHRYLDHAELERRCHCEAEGLAWLAQRKIRRETVDRLLVCVVPSCPRREHASRDGRGRRRRAIEAQGIVSPVDAERRVDHRQHHLQLEPGRHARRPVRPRRWL